MTRSGTSNLLFIILIFPNPMDQPTRLKKLSYNISELHNNGISSSQKPAILRQIWQSKRAWRLRRKDSHTKQYRLKPVVLNPQAIKKREDYFDVAGTTGSNCTLVAALFFHGQRNSFLPWVEFKIFLRKRADNSRIFVYTTLSCIT